MIFFPGNTLNSVDPHTIGILILISAVVYAIISFVIPVITVVRYKKDSNFVALIKAFVTGDIAATALSTVICYTLYHIAIIDPFTIAVFIGIQIFTSIILAACEHQLTDTTTD